MATSSITRNFVVEGESQVEIFARAIEESYQESLVRDNTCHISYDEITAAQDARGVSSVQKGDDKRPAI